jgi:hypothetical protein
MNVSILNVHVCGYLQVLLRSSMIFLIAERGTVSDLSKAAVIRGTCQDMCPEKERYQRESRHQVALYEYQVDVSKQKIYLSNKICFLRFNLFDQLDCRLLLSPDMSVMLLPPTACVILLFLFLSLYIWLYVLYAFV